MFSSLKFRDVFTEVNTGFPPLAYGSGSSVGSAVTMTGVRKLVFHIYGGTGSGASSVQLLLAAASVSAGTGSTFLNGSTSLLTSALVGSLASASGGVGVIEVRGEFLENNSVGPWVFPVLSVSGGNSMTACVTCQGFLRSYEPSSNYDTTNFVKSETDLL